MTQRRFTQIFSLLLADVGAFWLGFLGAVSITWLCRAQRIGGTFILWWQSALQQQLLVYVVLTLGAMLVMSWRGHYTLRIPFWDELLQLVKLMLLFGLLNGMVVLLVKIPISRFLWLTLWLLCIILLPLMRHQVRQFLHRIGYWSASTIILGAKEQAQEAYLALQSEPLLGFKVEAFITAQTDEVIDVVLSDNTLPVYRVTESELYTTIDALQPDNIVIALTADELFKMEGKIEQLGLRYRNLYMIPSLAGLPLFGVETLHFFRHEVLFLRIRNNLAAKSMQLFKRMFDLVAASVLCIVLSPLLIGIAYRIYQQGGKIFFGHERIGRHGKPFLCYKFCTMVPNADALLAQLLDTDSLAQAEWDKDFKLKNDPRITPMGAFLRKTSLDELPQLWNVLKGEMSLVGPRPIIIDELSRYEDKAEFYLCIRPGVTGLWQVSGRNDTSYQERVALDTWYVKNWNLWYDIAILFKTIGVVIKRHGAY